MSIQDFSNEYSQYTRDELEAEIQDTKDKLTKVTAERDEAIKEAKNEWAVAHLEQAKRITLNADCEQLAEQVKALQAERDEANNWFRIARQGTTALEAKLTALEGVADKASDFLDDRIALVKLKGA